MNLCVQSGGAVGHFDKPTVYRLIKEAGFSSIDLNIDTCFNAGYLKDHMNEGKNPYEKGPEAVIDWYRADIDAIRDAGLYIYQAHAPFPAYRPDAPAAFVDYSIETFKVALEVCRRIGCGRLIIHGISLTRGDIKHTQKDIDAINEHIYTSLIDTAKETGVIICLENLFYVHEGAICEGHCSNEYDAVAFIDHLNALAGQECFGICVDTGHLNLVGKNQYKYLTTLGKRIKAFHIHDNDGKSDLHLAPYTGTINWDAFCLGVKDAGYEGDLSFETFRQYIASRYVDSRLLAPWLSLIAATGRVFAERIQG